MAVVPLYLGASCRGDDDHDKISMPTMGDGAICLIARYLDYLSVKKSCYRCDREYIEGKGE